MQLGKGLGQIAGVLSGLHRLDRLLQGGEVSGYLFRFFCVLGILGAVRQVVQRPRHLVHVRRLLRLPGRRGVLDVGEIFELLCESLQLIGQLFVLRLDLRFLLGHLVRVGVRIGLLAV